MNDPVTSGVNHIAIRCATRLIRSRSTPARIIPPVSKDSVAEDRMMRSPPNKIGDSAFRHPRLFFHYWIVTSSSIRYPTGLNQKPRTSLAVTDT